MKKKNANKTKARRTLMYVLAAFIWLIIWHIASVVISEALFLVSPIDVVRRLFELIFEPSFLNTVWHSVSRIISGFILAAVIGSILGILSAQFTTIRILLMPPMTLIKATPVVSFIILALVFIRSKNLSTFISFLMVLPVIYTNMQNGILNVDKKLLEMARVFRVSAIKKLLYIYLPDVMPFFVSACSVSIGLCWKSGVAAEVIGLPDGSIGEMLYMAKLYLSTGDIFAWTIVVILLSIVFERVVMWLLKSLQTHIERRHVG